jgi:hypothetical protein
MAKAKKKSAPAKSAPKKTAKPAAKPAAAKKPAAKVVAKPVAAKQKKVAKAPEKVVKKAAAPAAPSKDKKLNGKKVAAAPQKPEKKAPEKEPKKAVIPEAVAAKGPAKKEGKVAGKKGKSAKKEETEEADDFVGDEDFGADEISEYEEELKAVEELDEESTDEEAWAAETKDKGDEEVILTDAEGRRYCRSRDCDQIGIVDGYCRYHYLLFWKKIQVRKKILMDGKLERYVEELTARYPDKFLEMIRRDLRTEKDFLAAIQELEIDESVGENEFEEDTSAYVEEIRGMGEATGVEEEEF